MGETVKSVLVNYAVCAFAGGITEYLSPQKAKSTLRIVTALVLIFVTVAPVSGLDLSVDDIFSYEEISEYEKTDSLMHTANLTEKAIYAEMQKILINQGINEYEIYIDTSIEGESNTVYLDSILIEVSKEFEGKIPQIVSAIPEDYKRISKVGVKDE